MSTSISIKELKELDPSSYQIVDIRDAVEISHGAIPGALVMKTEEIETSDAIDRSKKTIICCSRGRFSVAATEELQEKGWDAVSLEGGYIAWLMDVMSAPEEQDKAADVEKSLRKKFKKSIWSKFTKAINTYELVKPGDRIAVCISGGKDSMLMAKCFQELKLHNKFDFEVKFVVMDPGYSPENRKVIEDNAKSLRKKFKKSIWSKFTKAINTYELVKPGDRIAVCISGGKDSMLMAKCFQELKLHNKFDFEVKFVVMDPGYSPENRKVIEDNAKSLHIPITIFETDIFDSVYHVENSPCYLCARMRRGHLYHFAQQLGCNKIALGHHYDDVIETILMGMLYGAQVQTMMPKLHSIHFEGMELIRPLYLVREDDIKAWRDYNGLHFIQCACKFTDTCTTCNNEENRSKRVEIKELIKNLKKVNPFVESNIFRSVENVNIDTVVGYKQHGIRHNFLEGYDDNPGYVPEAEKAAAETEQEKEGK